MNNIININPRLEASKRDNLSTLQDGHVSSDNALRMINEALISLDEQMIRAEHVALYGEER